MTDDRRVKCVDCRHFRPWQCGNWRQAKIGAPVVGPALSRLAQWCPGYQPKEQR